MQRITVTLWPNGKHARTNDKKNCQKKRGATAPPYRRTVNKARTPHPLEFCPEVREHGCNAAATAT